MQLREKTILLTGGTRGVGRELVGLLARDNTLIILARNEQKLQELKNTHSRIETFACDLTNHTRLEEVADQILKKQTRVDLLINNAAIQFTPRFLDDDFRYETIRQEIDINFGSVCALTYLLLPALLSEKLPDDESQNKKALILNVNSGLGLAPKTSSAIYCATKGALNIFSKSLAYQLADTNIKVLQAFLPLVDTDMTRGRGTDKISALEAARDILRGIENETQENYIGKMKLFRLLQRFSPSLAGNIMRKA